MDVTKSNFDSVVQQFEQILTDPDCVLISIDTELTGLTTKNYKNDPFETHDSYYNRLKDSAKSFGISQYGICLWKWNKKRFLAYPFNFNLFPQSYQGTDKRLLIQCSSMLFLAQHGFDFNKWIKEGITYLSRNDEDWQKQKEVKAPNSPTFSREEIPLDQKLKDFIEQICNKIDQWLLTDKEKLELDSCDSFYRRITYQEIKKRYPELLTESGIDSLKQRIVVVLKPSEALQQQKRDKIQGELQQAVGFRKIIDLMAASQKLMVGHNAFLDLLHTYEKFIAPLPHDSSQWKSHFHELFPHFIDTKYMSTTDDVLREQFPNTALADLFEEVQSLEQPTIGFAKTFMYHRSESHQAGYDAYMTGYAFLRMLYQLPSHTLPISTPLFSSPSLLPFIDRLYMMRSDLHYSLAEPDQLPKRDNVFRCTFPAYITTADINQHFAQYGTPHIHWIDDTSCYLIFDDLQSPLPTHSDPFHLAPYHSQKRPREQDDEDKLHSAKKPKPDNNNQDQNQDQNNTQANPEFPESCQIM